ncbi:hypothetical protein BaRGS_00009130 [Batillaria attramentaria]|uniref:Uncharacterized protein n=1 Tax=Batillaria attramentaria TaxID=370345 RepID=A0ABD0LJ83_9CAEN
MVITLTTSHIALSIASRGLFQLSKAARHPLHGGHPRPTSPAGKGHLPDQFLVHHSRNYWDHLLDGVLASVSDLPRGRSKLVEKKYTALCEALLRTVVDHQGGARQSQKQREKQLQALRKQVTALWDAGDSEGVATVLGSEPHLEHALAWLIGVDRGKVFKERNAGMFTGSGQTIKESPGSDDTSMLATVKHLMQRFVEEKDFLLACLAGTQGVILSDNMKTALKSRLRRETVLTTVENNLTLAAIVCGLVERAAEDTETAELEHDGERYRLLARHEYGARQSGRDGRSKKESLAVERDQNREVLQDAVLALLHKKHTEERQLLTEMLTTSRFEEVQKAAQLESSQQRADRLAALRAKRQASNLESSADNLALLQEALTVLREVMRGQQGRGSAQEDDFHLHCEMMAGLLWLQNSEAEQHLGDFVTEELSEMVERQEQIVEEIRRNHCTNIAALVFFASPFKQPDTEADPVVEALDGKYDALRDKLLMQALIDQMGENNWRNLSERERNKRLIELKLKEKQLRREGKFDELAMLLGDAVNNEATLRKLMGESRDEYERKLKERLEKRKQRLAEGLREDAERERQKKMLQLKLEQRRLRREDDVFSTALLLQQHDHDLDSEQDVSQLQEIALTSLDLKHRSEMGMLMEMFDELSGGERDRGQGCRKSIADLVTTLGDIAEMFKHFRSTSGLGSANGALMEMLKDGLVHALDLKQQQLESEGKSPSENDVQVALLADLQEIQKKESDNIMAASTDMDADGLKQLIRSILKDKEQGNYDNLAKVLLQQGEDGTSPLDDEGGDDAGLSEEEKAEKKVVRALEMKYDALRDKLIIEALMKQHGETEWRRMSELERQRQVVEMRRKERQLRREGKMEEVDALLGQLLKHKQDLEAMLGESQQEQKRRLQERLARRKQLKAEREAAGLENVLENLQMHFEDEKAALLAALRGGADAHERERQRQSALVKLQRDAQRLQAEDKLDSAALIFSLGQQAAADHQESLLKERDRQRQLARERLMQRRRQILEGKEGAAGDQQLLDENLTLEHALGDGMSKLQNGALLALDKHQAAERDTLMQLLAHRRRDKEAAKRMQTMSSEELRLKLTRGEKEHGSWRHDSAKKVASLSDPHLTARRREKLLQKAAQRRHTQLEILGGALSAKLELERRELEKLRPGTKEDEIWEELCVCALADLQERQMLHFNKTQEAIFSKSKEELSEIRKAQKAASQEGWFESLGALVFTVGDMAGETTSLADRRSAEAKLEAEFQQQKQAIMQKGQQENIDADAMLRELEAQHEAKRQALLTDMERQRSDVMKRLQARRRRQAEHDNEAETALIMLRQAESQTLAAQEKVDSARGHQRSLLQERLQQRREARRKAAEESRQEELRSESVPSPMPSDIGRSGSFGSVGGLRREKTIIEADVSEDQKQAIYEKLMRQNLKKQITLSEERQRQEEVLKRKREARKGKREDEAAALFSLGERQKTSLEIAKKGERERQIAEMRERVSRVRYERTMTKKASVAASSKGYSDVALEEGDEKMEQTAKVLEEKLKQQAEMEKSGGEGGAGAPLDEKSRMDILKERRKQKKQQRQGNN